MTTETELKFKYSYEECLACENLTKITCNTSAEFAGNCKYLCNINQSKDTAYGCCKKIQIKGT